jgi:hypothetical protein
MQIDFFANPCNKPDANCLIQEVDCKFKLKKLRFGITDADSGLKRPAKVDFRNIEIWDVIVDNPNAKEVVFKAIDFCVEAYRVGSYSLGNINRVKEEFSTEGTGSTSREGIKKCEGFLSFDNKVLFLELKRRNRGNWVKDAREKFEETILCFMEHHNIQDFNVLNSVVSNMTHRGLHQNYMIQNRILKDKTGFEFEIKNKILIQ